MLNTRMTRAAVYRSEAPTRPSEMLPGIARFVAIADWKAWTRPEPITVAGTGPLPSRFSMSCVAWFMIAALMRAGDHVGWISRSRVATPETCGVAIEVPSHV